MNKIFKVIWSKSKQCYIVVSEIAKNKTGKKKIVVAGIFAALAMVNGVQDSQAINGSGARTGWNSNGVGFHPTQGLVVGPNMNDNTTIANGNVATVAIGAHSNASGSSSVAIGGAVVNGAGAIGLGWSTATGDNSVALGGTGSTNANGNNAFAASGGNASGESAIAIGSSAIAGGRGGVAVGWSAESAVNAVGIGFNAKAKANNTVAIGVQANNDNSIGDNSSSVSIGVKTRAREVGSMAMGVSADASGKYSIALGSGDVSGDYTATVNYPKATGEKAIAIGYNSNSSNERATAIGAGATASGTDSFAGVSGAAGGNSSIAIGKGASITAPTAGTTFGGQDSIAMGTGASANQHSSVTIGAGSTSDGVRNITIGPKASASGVDSIAIGNGGVGGDKNNTGVGGNGNTYTINVNDISTNVYYGTKSVDDGSIAFGNRANAAKGGLAIGTVSIADGGIAVGQSVLSKNGVAIGSAVSATAANAVAMGSKAEASSVGAVAIGGYSATDKTKAQGNNALAIGASAVTNGNETIAIGKSANASNANAVAVGKNAKASIANSVAIGSDSTTDTNATSQANTTINGITYNFAGATSDTGMQVSVGAVGKERQIKNVAAGEVSATSTDAINGSQLFAVASQIKPINYFSVKSSAVGNKNNDGATGTDAIAIGPGAQSSGNNGVSLGNGSQANAESVVSIGYQSNYGAQNNSKSIGIGWAAGFQSNGTENIGIGTDAGRKLTGSNNVSIGKSAGLGDVYTSGSVLLGQSATIINSTDKSKINDVVAIGNGAQGGAASSVAIGKGAKALGFSTIAIGENSNAKVKVGSAPSVAIGRNTIANGDYAVALGGGDNSGQFQGAKAAGVGTTAIGAATVTKDNTNFQTAVGFGATTDATDASAFGHQAAAMAKNATALGSAASATAENATALGTGAIAQVKDGVAIGSGSKATVDKGVKGYDPNDGRTNKYGGLTNNILTSTNAAVSVGEGASVTRQITGVAAGTSNTDAVNVAQLKSVNLAFSGNSGNNDVNLANGTLAIKGDTTYITTTANKDGITIAGKTQDITVNTNGVASANKGMADAKNVAQSINDAISKNAYTWTVSANGDAGESVAKGNKVDFNGDSSNITVERAGKKITTKLNKDITVDSVKANNKVSVGATTKQLVLDGTTGVMTAGIGTNAIKLDGTSATITAGSGNNAISLNGTNAQAAFGTGTNAVSINGKTGAVTGQTFTAGNTTINTTGLTSGTGSSAVSFGTNGISAGNQAINNVATGGSTDSNAANIGDVKRYVSGATLNLTDGANNKGSVQLGGQSLKVSSGTGINATVSGQTVNIGLTTDAQNAISNGIGLLGNVGNTGIKQLKDGNATFDIKGDGSVVKTTASSSGVTIAVDTDKLAANTNLAYTANSASPAKTVSLSKGLNFVNGSNTIAIVNDDGKVSFDLNAATKNQINTNTTGVAANKANIATNAADIATNKNKIAANTTDIATNKGKIATNTTNIAANTTALARNISLGADSGTKSSQSLSTGDVAFNIKGATGDYISTKMNGNTVEVSTKRSTINSDANSGVASVTGDDGLATAKNVADAINNAVTKSAYEWKLSANSEANPTTVSKGDIVDFTGGSNITVERDNKNISVKLNKNLTNLSSVSIGNNKGETIKLDGSNGGITADHADFKDNTGAGTSIDTSGIRINNGITDLTQIGMGTISLDNGSGGNTIVTTSGVTLTDGSNMSEYNAKGIAFGDATGTNTAQFGLEGISAANQQIKDVATGTADTDAVNVKQLKDTVGDQKLNISDGTKDSSVALKNQKLTLTGTGAAKATVNGQTITIDVAEGTLTPNTTNGTVTGTTGVAKATEVAAAINNTNTVLGDKIATNTTNIAHTIALTDDNGTSTTAKSLKDGNVSFNIKGDNKFISTAASGNDVKLTVNEQAIKDAAKAASSFKVKANAHAEEEVKGGDTITFNNGDNIEIGQTGKTFTIKTAKNMTVDSLTAGNTVINTTGLTSGTGASAVSFGTNGISAGNQVISNVASGTVNNNATDDSNAANIGDVKQAVANLSQNLNITDGTNNGTVDLKNQKLNVAGANGVTATVNNQTITVGLDANTVNATTKGIGLTADTGSTGNKYLKDGDVSFAVTGDGNLVSTTGTTAGVKVAVDAAKVKDLAVAAVTVSKDAQADNPITVTPTAGANSKDYAIGIDTTKLAAKTDLTYRANSAADANAKKVSLSKGLNFVDGGSTVATVDNDGKVSFDLNTATKNQINTNTTDIAANKGNITKNTAAIATNTAALARNISLGADAGTASSQSLSAADVAFNVKGATGDFVSTNMNGNTVEISTKRATINSNATTGEASVTGNDGLATAQNVADAINKAADAAKAGAAWNITTNSSTTDKTAVKGGDTVDLVNGDNIEITQDGTDKKKITVATKKDITVDSVTANNKVTVGSGANKITLDGTDGSVTGTTFTGTSFTGTSFTAGNTVINTNGLTNGTTAITGTGVTTDNVTVGGISIDKTAGINAGNKVISNVASGGTTLTNAANIGDVQNAVANLSQNLNITDGTHDGTVDLKNQKLNVAGANGVTATVNNQTITVGLDADTVNATTKGIGLTADTGSTGNKYLKDGDVSFAVTGDGSLVSTSATAAGVKVAVNSATITAGTDGTITGPTTDGVATAKNVADAINAAKKASKTEITANTGEAANATTGNVTLTSTTAADGHTIYDVKLNDKVTLGSGANAVTIDGTTGAITGKTATIGGVTVNGTANTIGGLSNTTWNGTAVSGRAATEDQLKAATGATTLKFTGDVAANTGSVNLKDDIFGIKGDGKYISTDVNGKNVNLTVSEAEVKKSAVAAVTVSTDTTDANNPLTVTPTTSADGTTKDYKVTIDGTKIANKTNLSYKANDGTAKQVSLADGLNFKNGTLTTASIDDAGVVKYDVNTVSITAGTDGTITGPTTDGVATAQNVADAINAAKKASKTEITANTGEAANATTGNVTLTSTTATDGHTIYDVKLNDKVTLGTGANAVTIDGTAGKATIGSSVVDGVNNTFTTGGANAVTLDGATGTITGTTANIGGVTVNGTANTIGGLSNTTWNGTATTGRAATEDQLKAVADAAGSQTWEITADKDAATSGAQTGTKKNAKVGKDDKVQLIAGENLTVNQNERDFTYSLNKDLVKMNSATFLGTGTNTTVITGDSITQTAGTQTNTSTAGGNTVADGTKSTETTAAGQVIKDGAKSNKSTVDNNVIDDGTGNVNTSNATSNTITDGTNASTITAGKAQIGTVGIDGVVSKITTGGTNAVVVNGADGTVKTGNVTVTGGTTNDITGLSNTTLSATDFATKGRAATEEQLKAATGATTLKFTGDVATNTGSVNLKDDTFGIKGDGKYISTDVNGKNVNLTVSEAEVKKSAVAAVTVSTDTTDANNPLTVTPTTSADGTTKDYKVTIDGTKIANKTNLSYKANDGTAKQVSLADGLNFKNGTLTTASIDDAGVVKYDVNTATITAGTDGTITGPTTDGVATAQNVADAINAAKKASKTEITANTGEAANATTGNVTLTSTTAADGHTIYDVKLNDKVTLGTGTNAVTIDGTAGKATIGSSIIDGVNKTFTTGGANAVTMDGAAGTIKTGTVTVTGGTTNDITGLSNTTVNSADFATKGRAATEEQLKAVGEQTWQITADKDATTSGAQTGTKKDAKVGKDDKVQLIAGENMTVNQNERDFTFTLNKDLVKMNSGTFLGTGTNKTVITGESITQTDGTKSNTSTVDSNVIDDGNGNVNTSNATSNTITDGTNTSTITAGKATIGSSIVDGVNNTFTTGGASPVTLNGATGTITGKTANIGGVTVDGTNNHVMGLANKDWTPGVTQAVSGRAATEDQLQKVSDAVGAGWKVNTGKVTGSTGESNGAASTKVASGEEVQFQAGNNLIVDQNGKTVAYSLNKALKDLESATFNGTGTNKTVINGDSITQTAGSQMNTSTAAGNTVADGTKSTETTAAGQVIKDGTKTNTSTVDENTIVDGAKSNKTTVDSNVIDDGTGNVNTSNATSNTITDGTNTSTITAGKATIGSSIIDGVNNTFTTGGTNAVKLDGAAGTIKTGTVTVTGGTTNDITGLSNTTVTSADFATKGRAATEEQLKAVGEQTWQITADKKTGTSGAQTGTKKDAKVGKDDKVQLIAGENMTINQNERDFTFTLNKDLVKMNSATFLGTGSNTTVITGNSITQTAGTQTNTSTAGGNTVTDGTKSTETTAAGQVIKDGAKSNKSTVDSNVIDDGNGNKNTSNATSNTITDGTNTSTITAGKANIGNIAVDGVNNKITMGNGATPVTLDGANGHLDGLTNTTWVPGVTKATTGRAATEDQLQQVSDAVGAGWKVNTGIVAGSSGVSNGAASTKVSSGEEVKLQAGDNLVIDQNGKTVSYSLNKDLTKMNSATFEATGGKTTVIKGDSIVQTDGGKTNTSNAAGNTVVDGNKSTATTAAGTTITDGAKTNTSTADKNVINDGAGNTNTATATSNTLADNAGNTNVSNATSNTLKNAAGDETKADAKGVTVKDAAGNNATFNKDGITITKTGKDTVSLTSNGLDNGNNKIVNVAAGVANTDAVNVGQLKEYAAKSTTELTANNGETAGSTTGNIVLTKTTAADGHTIYDNKLNDKITLGAADPTKAVTVDGTAGTIAVADKITLNGKDGKAGIGTVGIDGKDGIVTTGGTNSVKVDGSTGTVTGLTNKTWTPGSIVSGRAATEDQLKSAVADSGWKVTVDSVDSGKSTVVGTSPEKIKAEETVTFKAGNNMMVTQTGKSISYAVNPELTDMKSATFKDAAGNTTVTNGNGITITPGSANPTNPHAGPVSLTKDGLNNGNNQIKGVAPGTDPTDAVNVAQLNASNANTSQAINQVAGEVQHVGAHAAAMAALKPIQYDPLEPTQIMAGVGNYRGETAAALGLAHYTNENTMFNVGVSVGGNHNMVNAGVTHKFGYSPEKKNIPDRYKAGPISSVYVMQDEVSSLKKENAEQKYVIADQAARLTTLEAENEQQRRELAETKKGLDDLKAAVDKLLASKG
ncbi:YadA-like family protein [Veillonella sp. ACP1]|uniref:YadA-like family protein n=1 Tax=Veillonella sp. ACP1 TaxID=936588 RepID=UPI0002782C06|nr:YadA-like family protein [Veillonella sp. ACP1]EJO50432.1 hemagglutinin [Veillonella sp. ACP1]